MLDYLKYFFQPNHLLSLRPAAMQQRAVTILLIVFISFLAASIILKMTTKKQKDALRIKGLNKLFNLLMTMGIIGIVYLFFAWQGAALLSARFWLLIWFLTTVVWLVFILKYLLVYVPKKRQEIDNRRKFEKYIP